MNSIDTKELKTLLDNGSPIELLDVREAAEVREGKIQEAKNIPLSLLEFRLHELDKSKEYHVICLSGGRSQMACQTLENQGFKVVNVMGGMMSWDGKTV
ncbi:hypothetical protein Q75_06920 [Bacillus coahuilensis p1.1.43]|uniref:Rhodanese domain-containing protein n=1 Tax=Bacillus coahuilensis p1.1.43 TaxID=1150625 RepID=A0A147K8Y7_9BACI|nr:rhodanese-like domain-containing protein [Bacillus coahuilensis]KUP06811.1 hypothetical protein Q75_06920 [Bacillus coahuilensis p1.1.43]